MTKVNITQLLRPNIRDLVPYSSARAEYSGKDMIFLDANENSLGSAAGENYNRYPDPAQSELKELIGRIKGIARESIFLGNGSDEPIDLLIRCFCEPGVDNIITLPPTYGMYAVSAAINNIAVREVFLTPEFQVDTERVLAATNENSKLLFICSPNNPTGNLIDVESIVTLLDQFRGIVVLDEAYIDFAADHSLIGMLSRYNNLVILQTCSKAWGLAGLRLGMAFADPELIAILNKVKAPYNINTATQTIALVALTSPGFIYDNVQRITGERMRLSAELANCPCVIKVFPSATNFLLVKVIAPKDLYVHLRSDGIIVRNRSNDPLCNDCLRITVGNPSENNLLINSFKRYNHE
jgi:histidinol-phosphate aminotransferase